MSDSDRQEPRVLERPDHAISRQNIDENTLKVLYRLHNSGKKAYMVGGAVRDLLLGIQPKDFDVATDARPNEMRRLFRNSRIIGRRFRLVHVYFQEGVVEVATFRREPDPRHQDSGDDELLITSDNTYGTPREDAFRRDFTINALFYDISDFSVLDYVGGIDDLDDGIIRVIGDPDVRFQEDPVRMMRAVEFAARLGFDIDPETADGIERNRQELGKASPARMTEELVALLKTGQAGDAFQLMLDYRLFEAILPEAEAMVEAEERGLGKFNRIPDALDAMVGDGRELSDGTLLASLLLAQVLLRRYDEEESLDRAISRSDIARLIAEETSPFIARYQLSNARSHGMTEALEAFMRLCEPHWTAKQRESYIRRERAFDDGLALFEILTRATGEGQGVLATWTDAARGVPRNTRKPGADRSGGGRGRGRRRRRGRRRGKKKGGGR